MILKDTNSDDHYFLAVSFVLGQKMNGLTSSWTNNKKQILKITAVMNDFC